MADAIKTDTECATTSRTALDWLFGQYPGGRAFLVDANSRNPKQARMKLSPLTSAGLDRIATHKYRAGHYTPLDLWLDPLWAQATERFLPASLAANAVTAGGGFVCMVSYALTWYHTPNLQRQEVVPHWVHAVNAVCLVAYYALDCMDGKQARRTGTSSPLGQLFDHGVDCVCLLVHVTTVMAWFRPGGGQVMGIQLSLQFAWFVAQWEEYHTGVLSHSAGVIGITEVTYGIAVATLLNACMMDPSVYDTPLVDLLPQFIAGLGPLLRRFMLDLPLKHFIIGTWYGMVSIWVFLSISRVMTYSKTTRAGLTTMATLVSPVVILLSTLCFLPGYTVESETRFISIATGLSLCILSIKLLVFAMAKQTYAAFQLDCVPLLVTIFWTTQWVTDGAATRDDERIRRLWQFASLWYLIRLGFWTNAAMNQICDRLNIFAFQIKPRNE